MAMMNKNYLLKKRAKMSMFWELLIPIITGYCMRLVIKGFKCDPTNPYPHWDPEKDPNPCMTMDAIRDMFVPFIFVMFVPNLTSISARFII